MKKRTKIINSLFLSTIALSSVAALSIVAFDNQNKLSSYSSDTNNQNLNTRVENLSTYITASERSVFVDAKNQLPSDVVNSLTVKSEYASNDQVTGKPLNWFKPSANVLRFVEIINPTAGFNELENIAVRIELADDWSGELQLEFVLLKNYSVGGVPIIPPGGDGIFPSIPYHIDIGYMNNFTVMIPILSILGLITLLILIGGISSGIIIRKNSLEKSNSARENNDLINPKKAKPEKDPKKDKPEKEDKKVKSEKEPKKSKPEKEPKKSKPEKEDKKKSKKS